jgi:ABC-type nitrate/sulfonate/bicarbonate transport system permease component
MSALDSQELTVEDAKRQRVRASGLLLKVAGIAALLAIWQAGVTFLDVPTYILTTPKHVWAAQKSRM